jgi:hypothetical protein
MYPTICPGVYLGTFSPFDMSSRESVIFRVPAETHDVLVTSVLLQCPDAPVPNPDHHWVLTFGVADGPGRPFAASAVFPLSRTTLPPVGAATRLLSPPARVPAGGLFGLKVHSVGVPGSLKHLVVVPVLSYVPESGLE